MTARADDELVTDLWLEGLEAVKADPLWREPRSLQNHRTLLSRLYEVLLELPSIRAQDFERILETDLAAATATAKARLDKFGPGRIPPAKDRLHDAAVLLRALDALIHEDEGRWSNAPDSWLTLDGRFYVIPVRRAVVKEGGPRSGQFFSRRGLLHNRVIPRHVEGVRIEVDLHPDMSLKARADGRRTFGAALFTDFALVTEHPTQTSFVATSSGCRNGMEAEIGDHCDRARQGACDTVVWPELTMAPDSVTHLARNLLHLPLDTKLPPVVVAGSWHIQVGGSWKNLATVLDGRGQKILTFGKNQKFTLRTEEGAAAYREEIDPHGAIHILATEDELIAFAICKDFCDLSDGKLPVVSKLDVDLVLVPSMGREDTILAHRDLANHMKVAHGTRVVVAQQAYPHKAGGASKAAASDTPERGVRYATGYVLKAPHDPKALELEDLAERSNFTTFQRSEASRKSSPAKS
ncbi:MAG: hypothetical protein AB1698_10225 [Pseudomonadota bacterium]